MTGSFRALCAVACTAAFAGCGTPGPAPIVVVADTLCITAKKRTWSIDDTPQTIQEAVRYNAGIDRACNGKKPTV